MIDEQGQSQGVVGIDQARYLAYEADLDLVQVNFANPPVVKIMDYGKYRYSQEKQASKQKVKSRGPGLKEIRIGLKIDSHDLFVKIKQAQKFLREGDKVKLSVKLIGREMIFQNRLRDLLENFRQQSGGIFEGPTERMGNRFSAVITQAKISKEKDEAKNR